MQSLSWRPTCSGLWGEPVSPHLLVRQVAVCNAVFEKHFDRHKEWPQLELKRALDPGLSTFPPQQKLLADESQHYALATVVDGALQVVASRVQPNPAMSSRGLGELLRGIDQLNAKRG